MNSISTERFRLFNTSAITKVFCLLFAFSIFAQSSALCAAAGSGSAAISPLNLRTEYKVNPLGIDARNPRLDWIVQSEKRNAMQSAYRILVASNKDELSKNIGDLWDSGRIESDATTQIEYAGKTLSAGMQCFWKVKVWDQDGKESGWSETAAWSMGLLDESDWKSEWIGFDIPLTSKQKRIIKMQMPFMSHDQRERVYLPCPYLRKEFKTGKEIKRATIYSSALGIFELHLNGQRVSKDYFTPGWTDFNKRVYYLTYDVTDMLKEGNENVLGAILSDGWYAGNIGRAGQRLYGDKLRLRAELHIEYADGTKQVVASDGSWKARTGAILEADIQDGETYDARRGPAGWDKPGYDDSKWKKVKISQDIKTELDAYPGMPIRKTSEIKPVEMTEPKPGVFVFNLGQNFAGWARLKVKGNQGDKIVLRFAEMLNDDGTIYTTNLRGARVTDTYTLRGGGEEIWEPRFTFHGFQYVEITGYPGTPDKDTITGISLNSDLVFTGEFETSDPMLNKLYSNIVWGQRSNYFEVPTDCPQRDERLGWTGDAQVFIGTAAYNMDVAPFFTKWIVDLEDAQNNEGGFIDIAPRAEHRNVTSGWGDAGIICPWTVLRFYDDKRLIEKHYDSMLKWMSFLEKRSEHFLSPPLGSYGDWLNVKSPTPQDFISTAYTAHSAELMSEMAEYIGKHDDSKRFAELFNNIRNAFVKKFVAPDGKIECDSQTAYLMALKFNLLPENLIQPVTDRLIEKIRERDWSLSTGFLGVNILLPTLTQTGNNDIAYRLLRNRKYPSWLYSIDQGATTIWERWNSYTIEDGFGDPGMNSFNHYAYGSAGEWMFSTMAGIDTDSPGFKNLVIHPRPGGGISFTKASYDSIHGKISVDWKVDNGVFNLKTTIPANTKAKIYLPCGDAGSISESGAPVSGSADFSMIENTAAETVFKTGSGSYDFSCRIAE
ncbi:MAG TPA: glycoside hydrolase family 78 protein [bacterium]|nr:glycoside hydrolase family 78 protein [bacterium]